ncbi:MAG: dihydroorotate dehydrogenase-like protein [Bacteroidota bacterium]
MIDLSTKYMGLNLKNPIIAASCGLTNSINNFKLLEEKGIGAIVLKSIFEEQIMADTEKFIRKNESERMQTLTNSFKDIISQKSYEYEEAYEYIWDYAQEQLISEYLNLIKAAKKTISIPIIASINCVSAQNWHYFARRIEEAGADAIELNIYLLPTQVEMGGESLEKKYLEIIEAVKKQVAIPVSLKLGFYFTGLSKTITEFSNSGIKALVLFNRPYTPDIDIDKFEITASKIYSSDNDYSHTTRWLAILSGRLGCDIAAATGIHDYKAAIKQILAGADAIQIASVLYEKGFDSITEILDGMKNWMLSKKFSKISDFKGKMSQINIKNQAAYERVQFMKLYSKIE